MSVPKENKTEILAPAGSYEAFLAAVANGADAVYLAGKSFGARAYAANFSDEELKRCICYAHLNRVRVYVTVNTLLKDEEMAEALAYCHSLYTWGVDAVIVQDWGLAGTLASMLPHLPVFASTQMSIHNSPGVAEAARNGIKRVILAREMSLTEISLVQEKSDLDLEVFVHGALCVCYSGQCFFSSMVGGRSGNRGRCAQPCRLYYYLKDDRDRELAAGYLLSTKDLRALEFLPQLTQAGVASFKIEGRMKRPEYVATVTKAYTGGESNPDDLAQIFNREFTSGYLLGNPGCELMSYQRPNNRGVFLGRVLQVWDNPSRLSLCLVRPLAIGDGIAVWVNHGGHQGFTVQDISIADQKVQSAPAGVEVTINLEGYAKAGDRVFKTADTALNKAAQESIKENIIPLLMQMKAVVGQKLVLSGHDDLGYTATVTDDYMVEAARKSPADYEQVYAQLSRLGNTFYTLAQLDFTAEGPVMLPASVLNRLRRELINKLTDMRTAAFAPPYPPVKEFNLIKPWGEKQQNYPRLVVHVDDFAAAEAVIKAGADELYAGGFIRRGSQPWTVEQLGALSKKLPLYYLLPSIAREEELPFYRHLIQRLKDTKVTGWGIGNIWGLTLLEDEKWTGAVIGDMALNSFNSFTAEHWLKRGLRRVALSPELSFKGIGELTGVWPRECLVHGNLSMMVSAYCPLGALCGGRSSSEECTHPCQNGKKYYLQDEKGFRFPFLLDNGCRMHLFNGHQLCMIEDLPRFINYGVDVLRLDLRRYGTKEAGRVVQIYRQALSAAIRGDKINAEAMKQELAGLSPGKLTKGHYYRGVE